MPNQRTDIPHHKFNPYFVIILFLTLTLPVLVLPSILDNAFKTPKILLLLFGVSIMLGIYAFQFLQSGEVLLSSASTPKVVLLLIFLNFFSFFYTSNYYFTIVAAVMNVTCLVFFYFVSLNTDGRQGLVLMMAAAFSGLLVSIITWLQYFDIFIIFKWAHPGMMVMGTIGNSNYLGAYFIFPLFAMASMIFLLKGRLRLIPLLLFIFMMIAFLFTRARAGWFGFFLALPLFLWILSKIYKIRVLGYFVSNRRRIITYGVVVACLIFSLWYAAPERFRIMMGFRNVTRSDTLRLRMAKYYRSSIWLFKKNPLFGTGLWSYRNLVYDAQAEINEIDEEYFKNYPEPKPRRVHTDFLEILNDGGLLAASVLLLFFIIVMRHGWKVIDDEEVECRDRVISGTAFCSSFAIMLATIFFFPFRINSTTFMMVFMLGIMESVYLRNYGLVSTGQAWKSEIRHFLIPMVFLGLIGMVWFTGLKPFMGEINHFKYKKALAKGKPKDAEQHILKAIEYDPHNTSYCLFASQLYMNILKDSGKAREFIERAIIDYNGDVTRWSIYFLKGLLKYQTGSLYDAKAAFEKALYYNPTFETARQKLVEVEKVIKDHDKVLIKFR